MSDPEIHIREIKARDLPRAAELLKQLGYDTTVENLKSRLALLRKDPTHQIFVAEIASQGVCACIHLCEKLSFCTDAHASIMALVVDHRLRRRGIGKTLMEFAEAWTQRRGYDHVRLSSNEKRTDAHDFYQRIGYEKIKTSHFFEKQLETRVPSQYAGEMGKIKKWPKSVIIYTDGASRGNPGLASIGIHVTTEDGESLQDISEALGLETNNVAEYTAVLRALEMAKQNKVHTVTLRSDSELMIRQMTGLYKVKSEGLKELYSQCQKLVAQIGDVRFEHVRREFNAVADRLANEALDR